MRVLLAAAAVSALALAACDQTETAADDAAPAAEEAMADDAMSDDTMADDGGSADMADDADMADAAPADAYMIPAGTPANIARAVQSAERTPEMTARDIGRLPAEMMTMASIDEGDHVIEFAGFGQFYTTMLAEAVGPEGQVDVYDLPYTDRFAGEASRTFDEAHDNVAYHQGEYDEMTLPSDVDTAMIVLYYHDLHVSTNTVDIPAFNRKVYDALKPGGTYFIIDHVADSGAATAPDDLHRIDPQVIRDEVTAAGFELAEESDLLRHPEDDHTVGPFQMRGETDRVVFVFRKPE